MPAPLLELQSLQKYFPVRSGALLRRKIGWVKAVDGVDFTINPGETLGLIGVQWTARCWLGDQEPAKETYASATA